MGETPLMEPDTITRVDAMVGVIEHVKQVLDFLLSEDGQRIIEETGYGPLANDSGGVKAEPIVENELEEGSLYALVKDSVKAEIFITENALELTYGDIFTKGRYEPHHEHQGYVFYPMMSFTWKNGIESIEFRIDDRGEGYKEIVLLAINLWPKGVRDEDGVYAGYTESDLYQIFDYPKVGEVFVETVK